MNCDNCKNCEYSSKPSYCDTVCCDGTAGFKIRKIEAIDIYAGNQAIKSDFGKLRPTLVPIQGIKDVSQVRAYGVAKYGSYDNWKQVEAQRYIDALYRHLLAVVENPLSKDEESGIEHYKHLACNAMLLCEVLKNGRL